MQAAAEVKPASPSKGFMWVAEVTECIVKKSLHRSAPKTSSWAKVQDGRTLFSRLLKTWFKPPVGSKPSDPSLLPFTFGLCCCPHFISSVTQKSEFAMPAKQIEIGEEKDLGWVPVSEGVRVSWYGPVLRIQTVHTRKKPVQLPCQEKTSLNILPCWRSSSESLPNRLQCCILFPSWTAMVSWSSAAFHFLLRLINISAS